MTSVLETIQHIKDSLSQSDVLLHLAKYKEVITLCIETNSPDSIVLADRVLDGLKHSNKPSEQLEFELLKSRSLYACYRAKEALELLHSIQERYGLTLDDEKRELVQFNILSCKVQLSKSDDVLAELKVFEVKYTIAENNSKLLEVYSLLSQYFVDLENSKAVEYAIEGNRLAQQLNNKMSVVMFSGLLFNLQQKIGDNESAIKSYDLYFKAASDIGLHQRLMLSSRLAVIVAKKINDVEREKRYRDYGIKTGIQLNTPVSLTVALDLMDKSKDLEKALSLADNIKGNIDKCSKADQLLIHFCLSKLYVETKSYDEALEHLNLLMEDFDKLPTVQNKIKLLELLVDVLENRGEYELAFTKLKVLKELQLSDYNIEMTKSISELNTKYETEQKESQLKQLVIENLNNELRLVKSQMNPHFLFNVLSTIQNLVSVNENEKAIKAIQAFSYMMRSLLDNNHQDNTSIEKEISLLKSYCDLEKLHLANDFNYEIILKGSIDESYDTVPAMFLQPIVENAIKHGLWHKMGDKYLLISFERANEVLTIVIDDNGVGRSQSAEINKVIRKDHQSFATSASERRIALINTKAGYEKVKLTVEDKIQEGKSTGTKVSVVIV
jgi:tetratricopeptide (TPR) repeat protein